VNPLIFSFTLEFSLPSLSQLLVPTPVWYLFIGSVDREENLLQLGIGDLSVGGVCKIESSYL
jgi:hypothetical protein